MIYISLTFILFFFIVLIKELKKQQFDNDRVILCIMNIGFQFIFIMLLQLQ